jgi:hypothetical protein
VLKQAPCVKKQRSRARGPIGAEAADVRAPLLCISPLHQEEVTELLKRDLVLATEVDRTEIG